MARASKGFTLIELLTVTGIIATLSAVTVLVINPSELFKQSRDSRRLNDLETLNKVIYYATFGGKYIGDSGDLHVSIPDTSMFCANLGLTPSPLSGGWSYICSTSDRYQYVDGSGWLAADFSSPLGTDEDNLRSRFLGVVLYSTAGALIPKLPIDPLNTTTTGNYYMYLKSGSEYEFVTKLESVKYQTKAAEDGGADATRYELGTNLTFWGTAAGL